MTLHYIHTIHYITLPDVTFYCIALRYIALRGYLSFFLSFSLFLSLSLSLSPSLSAFSRQHLLVAIVAGCTLEEVEDFPLLLHITFS